MPEKVARKFLVDRLRQLGMTEAADEAERVLPDPVEFAEVVAFCEQHGLSRDQLTDRMGGSP